MNFLPNSEIVTVFEAVERNRPDVLLRLIKNGKQDVKNQDFFWGLTALHLAAMKGYEDCLHILLYYQTSNINEKTDKRGLTPLMYALEYLEARPDTYNNPKECIKILLDYGADTTIRDKYGNTALHYIMNVCPDIEVVKWLFFGVQTPNTLLQSSKFKIWIQFARNNNFCKDNILKLCLPQTLINYISLDLEDTIEENIIFNRLSKILF